MAHSVVITKIVLLFFEAQCR